MIEALSCGTPLITTKTGGVGEVITNKVGFFVKPTVPAIVQLVTKLSAQKRRLSAMRNICISYAKNEFGQKINAQIIEDSLL